MPDNICNTLFCILREHKGDRHTDTTGYSWVEAQSTAPVIARTYAWKEL